MRADVPKEPVEGAEYLNAVRHQEMKCSADTGRAIGDFGRNLPSVELHLGTVLSLLERAA